VSSRTDSQAVSKRGGDRAALQVGGFSGHGLTARISCRRHGAVLELYDLEADRGEEQDLAREKPDVLARCGGSTRTGSLMSGDRAVHAGHHSYWQPGGKPGVLCRYQDASWKFERPAAAGDVERTEGFEIGFVARYIWPGRIVVNWQGQEISGRSKATRGRIHLAVGQGTIDVNSVRRVD